MLLLNVLCTVIWVATMLVTAAVVPVAATLAKIGSVKTIVSIPTGDRG